MIRIKRPRPLNLVAAALIISGLSLTEHASAGAISAFGGVACQVSVSGSARTGADVTCGPLADITR